jgi:hypothetical protein
MLDAAQIEVLADKHGVPGDVLKFVRELEHLTVAEVIARSALSFHKPNAIMADATAAVSYLEGRRWPL